MIEVVLRDPGLVENAADSEHCVQACFQMAFRTVGGIAVPSFDEMDSILHQEPGKYTWEYNLLAELALSGFDVGLVQLLDLEKLARNPSEYLLSHYGPEAGQENVDNSNLEQVAADAKRLLDTPSARVEVRSPNVEELRDRINGGYYLLCTINQRVLQADPGYVAHAVLAYGYSSRGLRVHNPGPPATAATEVAWDLWDRAWSYPDEKSRNYICFRGSSG